MACQKIYPFEKVISIFHPNDVYYLERISSATGIGEDLIIKMILFEFSFDKKFPREQMGKYIVYIMGPLKDVLTEIPESSSMSSFLGVATVVIAIFFH